MDYLIKVLKHQKLDFVNIFQNGRLEVLKNPESLILLTVFKMANLIKVLKKPRQLDFADIFQNGRFDRSSNKT